MSNYERGTPKPSRNCSGHEPCDPLFWVWLRLTVEGLTTIDSMIIKDACWRQSYDAQLRLNAL